MGLFDKAKEFAAQTAAQAQESVSQMAEEAKQANIQKRDEQAAKKELASTFHPTQKYGELEIDAANKLVKIKHATGDIQRKKGGIGSATAAVVTLGASAAISAATKPRDIIVPFSEVRSYSIVQDDDVIQGGTLGTAAVGGLLFGGVGAIAGAAAGKRKGKKVVNNMALRVDLASFEMPCAMVSYISKATKTTDKEYAKAVSSIQSAMACLDLILEQNGRQSQ